MGRTSERRPPPTPPPTLKLMERRPEETYTMMKSPVRDVAPTRKMELLESNSWNEKSNVSDEEEIGVGSVYAIFPRPSLTAATISVEGSVEKLIRDV